MMATSTAVNLDITADLDIDIDGRPMRLSSADGKILVETTDMSTFFKLARGGPWRKSMRAGAKSLARFLVIAGLEAELHVSGRPLLQMGKHASSLIPTLFGLKHTRIFFTSAWLHWHSSVPEFSARP